MRFLLRTEVWMATASLDEAQAAIDRAMRGARSALGDAASEHPHTGALAMSTLEPVDEEAHAALRAEGLGPGISSALWGADG